jgi:hypothetical protein
MSTEFRERLSALLPAPRDDEPASLRHDIIDELADHLTCAYHRELLRGTDPAAAKARTLQRFGDPAAVARRLWLDAMKGKIMAQRILIATCVIVMLVCLQVVNLISQRSSQSAAELTLANRRIIEYLSQSQATNQEMMRHLQSMDNAAQARQAMESCNVAFRLTLEMPDGPPATGFDVRFGRGYGDSYRPDDQSGTSDERGSVDFQVDLPGDWKFTISRTIGEATWKTQGTVKFVAGGSALKFIVCPKVPPETSPVKIRVDWPADLAEKNLCVEAQFIYTGLNLDTSTPWRVENLNRSNFYQTRDILYGPGLRHSEIAYPEHPDLRTFVFWRFTDGISSSSTKSWDGILTPIPVFVDIRSENFQSGSNGLEFEEGSYRLARLIILRPRPYQHEKFKGERFDLIAHAESVSSFAAPVYLCNEPPDDVSRPIGGTSELDADKKIGRILLPPSYWREAEPVAEGVRRPFEVEAGTVNLWTIPLPDELTKVIRDRLDLKQPAKPKSGE